MDHFRRKMCLGGIAALAAPTVLFALDAVAQTEVKPESQVIRIEARKFVYTPNQIALKKGASVILEFHALDFVHGFSIPDMHIRADLHPGIPTRIALTPDATGEFDFLCDNFCGEGHENMSGKIIVTA